MLRNTMRQNVCFLKTIGFLHLRHHLKVVGEILKNVQKGTVCFMMKMRLGVKNRSQRYDINEPRPRHGH